MKLSVCEKFLSFQGEGNYTGQLAYFIRVTGCNLKCRWCDSTYAFKGGTRIEIDDLRNIIDKQPEHTRIIITGGEPMLYQEALAALISHPDMHKFAFAIETNGTIAPTNDMELCVQQFNISPKLSSSGNGAKAINMKALKALDCCSSIFKFVVKSRRDFDEAQEIIEDLDIWPEDIWIMPEGRTHEAWQKNALKIIPWVLDAGYNLSPRMHISIWGNKKGV